jgi:hypothetical protein
MLLSNIYRSLSADVPTYDQLMPTFVPFFGWYGSSSGINRGRGWAADFKAGWVEHYIHYHALISLLLPSCGTLPELKRSELPF